MTVLLSESPFGSRLVRLSGADVSDEEVIDTVSTLSGSSESGVSTGKVTRLISEISPSSDVGA
jgi:hypothetical protein